LTVPQFLLLIFHYLQHIVGVLQQGLIFSYGPEGFVAVMMMDYDLRNTNNLCNDSPELEETSIVNEENAFFANNK